MGLLSLNFVLRNVLMGCVLLFILFATVCVVLQLMVENWILGPSVASVHIVVVCILMACALEFLVLCGLFCLMLLYTYFEMERFLKQIHEGTVDITDFAVQVWGLPPDALEDEIIEKTLLK